MKHQEDIEVAAGKGTLHKSLATVSIRGRDGNLRSVCRYVCARVCMRAALFTKGSSMHQAAFARSSGASYLWIMCGL